MRISDSIEKDVYYVPSSEISGSRITLEGEEFHHAVRVARKTAKEPVVIVDGEGHEYLCSIDEILDGRLICRIDRTRLKPNEPLTDVTLFQALIKGKRFDYVVEKSVELGVNTIVPFTSARTITIEKSAKIERWQRLAVSAMKQAGRSVLPKITGCTGINEIFLKRNQFDHIFLAVLQGGVSISQIMGAGLSKRMSKIGVMVGPEGGFSEQELISAGSAGFSFISLGRRRLRSETAPLAALSRIYALEEL